MESQWPNGGSSSDFDYGFAFDDSNFSDRVLRIEIMTDDTVDPPPTSDSITTMADWARHHKRRRFEQPDMDDKRVAEFLYGDQADTVVRVKTLHISSPILAAKSPFFCKLFSNGMTESEQRHVTLKINACEEAALMELLNFMYSNTLNVTAAPALLDVLIAADKFGVSSCMRYSTQLLLNLPMTLESALLYLELPHTVVKADVVQPLKEAAKRYLVGRYKEITKFQKEVMALPLSGIEVILASDDLQVTSEDYVYEFVLMWARQHYTRLEERREVLSTRLAPLIRFPYMTCPKLEKVLTCNDFHGDCTSKLVFEALFFKAMLPHRQPSLAEKECASLNHRRFVERAYKFRPIKVVEEFELTQPRSVVYFNLKREMCATLLPVCSQRFQLGGQEFSLAARCMDQQGSSHCFALRLVMLTKSSVSFSVDYEVAARSRPTEEYVSKSKGSYTFTDEGNIRILLGIPWTSFMAEDSLFFINDVLHLRVELTFKH